ncbi:S-adenosyl-L-methionine-dependent methyltransferase [Parasitella parasitica]|nr:S-adenosyl-L-methionine-dependent methyltransferase [Parasitella parasitica]
MSAAAPHLTASNGFQAQADAYAKARPSYPDEAIAFISKLMAGHQNTPNVLDLGAGTGIMTKLLVEKCGFEVTAVEPVDNMRLQLESTVPKAKSAKGTAWSIPVEDESQDMVMLAQCFHWFDDIESLKEIHRVLRPGGLVVLIWNMESRERSAWVAKLRDLYEVYDASAPQYRMGYWKNVFLTRAAQELYALPLQHRRFTFDVPAKRDHIWPRIMSKSYIAILDQDSREKLHQDVKTVLEDPQHSLPENGSDQEFIYCHDTDMYWTYKK